MDTAIAVALIGVGTTAGAAAVSTIGDWASARRDHGRWLRERRYEAAVDFIASCRAVRWDDDGSWTNAVRRGDELAIVAPVGMRPLVSTLLLAAENLRQTEGLSEFASVRERYGQAIDLFLESAQPLITGGGLRSRRLANNRFLARARFTRTVAEVSADHRTILEMKERLRDLEARLVAPDSPSQRSRAGNADPSA